IVRAASHRATECAAGVERHPGCRVSRAKGYPTRTRPMRAASRRVAMSIASFQISRCAGSAHAISVCVYDHFAVLFGERAKLGLLQDVEYQLRRSAQAHASGRHDEGTVDKNGMRQHGI